MKSVVQETDSGQTPSLNEKPSQPVSQPKPTKSAKLKELPTNPSSNGLPKSERKKKNLSGSVSESGAEPTPKKRKSKSLMPVPKAPSETKRSDAALKKLKIKPESLLAAPQITKMIKTTVLGGLKAALEAMRYSHDDPEIRSFLKVYDKIPVGDRNRVPWEAVAIAAKVNHKHLVGAIQFAVQAHCSNRSRFIAISNHPDVMEKRVKFAKMAGGEKDRTALDIMNGALASPKGPTFIGKQVAVFGGGGGKSQDKDDDEEGGSGKVLEAQTESDGFDDLFPSPSEIQNKLVPIRQRLLEASSTPSASSKAT